jgi:RND family efflux transporter MFP subunit
VLQAEAALATALARFFEGQLATEAKLLEIQKTRAELAQSRRELAEAERKHADQVKLHWAGGVTEEAIRSSHFSIQSAVERIALMEKDIEIRLVGLRDQDLIARGIIVPDDAAARKQAIVALSVAALEAESASAQARLDAARTELRSARLALDELRILAPISGVVAARYMEAGERIKREDKLFTIIDIDSLYAVAPVFESEALRVSVGMEARVSVDGSASVGESADFAGIVDLVSPVADSGTASFSVRVILHDPSGRLKPGMFARVTITAGEPRKAAVVPESAIVERTGQSGTLCFISGGIVTLKQVSFGSSIEAGRVITSGAVPGDVLVDKPDPTLKEGQHVSISD